MGGAQRVGAGREAGGAQRGNAHARTSPREAGPMRGGGGTILSVGNMPLLFLTGYEPRLVLFSLRDLLFFIFPYCCYFCCDSVLCTSSSCPQRW